ncbi:MAG: hypothetical protein WCJ26_02295 [bacterium]
MITLDSPHMGVNDSRAPATVRMWNTWNINSDETPDHLTRWIAAVADSAPGGKIKDLVFSCHGNASYLQMGQGIDLRHAPLFGRLAGKVDKIWFRACLVAAIQTPGSPTTGDGNLFCAAIARAAQCYVVASTELQVAVTNRVLPYGKLDSFEGLVLSYGPEGRVTWSSRYPSTFQRNTADPGSWTWNSD